jgi:hypothetical protein
MVSLYLWWGSSSWLGDVERCSHYECRLRRVDVSQDKGFRDQIEIKDSILVLQAPEWIKKLTLVTQAGGYARGGIAAACSSTQGNLALFTGRRPVNSPTVFWLNVEDEAVATVGSSLNYRVQALGTTQKANLIAAGPSISSNNEYELCHKARIQQK